MPDRPRAIDPSQRTAAVVAAVALLITFALVVFANFGLRGGFYGADMAETARRVAAAQSVFRLSIAFDIVYCIGVVVLLAATYTVLSPVSRHLAILASGLKLVYGVTAVLMVLGHSAVVRLATDAAYLQSPETRDALLRFNSIAIGQEYYVGLAFWSLSATIFWWLWLKSRYIPAPLAILGLASAAWCVFCTVAYIIQPGFTRFVNLWWFDTPFAVLDITLSIWLLVKGLRGETAVVSAG